MFPVLFHIGGLPVRAYAVFVLLGFLVAWRVRKAELARLGHGSMPGYGLVPIGALLGAVVGSKLGMLMFEDWQGFSGLMSRMLDLDFTGKTVVGALAGGYLGVEIAKKKVGITRRTGDAFAVPMLLGMAIGRVGCLAHGCCAGAPWNGPWALDYLGALRHPAPLYEGLLDLILAAGLWVIRRRPHPEGELFRQALLGYAVIRLGVEPLRADFLPRVGPCSWVQVVCLTAVIALPIAMRIRRRTWYLETGPTP